MVSTVFVWERRICQIVGTDMCRGWCENEDHQPAPSPAMGIHLLSSIFRAPAGLLSCGDSHR